MHHPESIKYWYIKKLCWICKFYTHMYKHINLPQIRHMESILHSSAFVLHFAVTYWCSFMDSGSTTTSKAVEDFRTWEGQEHFESQLSHASCQCSSMNFNSLTSNSRNTVLIAHIITWFGKTLRISQINPTVGTLHVIWGDKCQSSIGIVINWIDLVKHF